MPSTTSGQGSKAIRILHDRQTMYKQPPICARAHPIFGLHYNEAREPFFSWFSQKKRRRKKPLHDGSYTRVGCLAWSFSVCVCIIKIQPLLRPRLTTALNAHGANSSPGGLCAHTQTKPSRAGAVVSRSQLVELGAATCVGTWLGHG